MDEATLLEDVFQSYHEVHTNCWRSVKFEHQKTGNIGESTQKKGCENKRVMQCFEHTFSLWNDIEDEKW